MAAFKQDEAQRNHMRAAFVRMLAFHGLSIARDGIKKAANWNSRKTEWFTTNTHNSLRLTRMLKSLNALGFAWEAAELQRALRDLCATEPYCGIDATARQFWEDAVPAA